MNSSKPKSEAWRLPRGPLQLERRQDFADDAIIGGVSGFVQQWVHQASAVISARDLQAALGKLAVEAAQYAELGKPQRKALLAEVERLGSLVEQAMDKQRTRPPSVIPALKWDSPLSQLPGIGPARTETLAKAGLATVGDLLQYYPLRYEDRRQPQPVAGLQHRQSTTLVVTVTGEGYLAYRGSQKLAIVPATDGSDLINLTWFNQPYRATQLKPGTKLVVTGMVRLHKGQAALAVAEAEIVQDEELHVRRIVPIYSAPPFSQVVMRKLVQATLEGCNDYPEDRVPAELLVERDLMPLGQAFREVHFPGNMETLKEARARLAYDELFALQVRLAQRRRAAKATPESAAVEVGEALAELRAALPFALTRAQERVMGEVLEDLRRPEAANRLIHGDVGAGKTVVAAVALLAAARAGKQAAIMAPTELLAQQHYRTLRELLGALGVEPVLLTGSMNGAERRRLLTQLMTGEAAVAVGTHALFQESVAFKDLAVAVIDEQHRFGVRQRAMLVGKGPRPNCFVMSATPIPRTLALTAYGDFDVSILDQLPPGRKPVVTEVTTRREVGRGYRLISDVVSRGRQAYMVCPIIEKNEGRHLAAAESMYAKIREDIFPSLKMALVHGKMDASEREAIMERFRAGELEALIATTVIEVGVDVPNATAIVIMNAECFGLAQLHQLRGRVARSSDQAYCLLVCGTGNLDTIERLQVLERTNDGFLVAEEDLRRRGPGEMAGTKQAGVPDLRMADLLADTRTLAVAREDAFRLVDEDPKLEAPENAGLREWLGGEDGVGAWTL
ncbi:MAG: ATP-dependent DNA helicase RecG [Armatimonadia bacterium]